MLQADGWDNVFRSPRQVQISGCMVNGAENTVDIFVASIADFLIMKSYALAGRDKPKDAYDLCFCLDNDPEGLESLAKNWISREEERDVIRAKEALREKFRPVDSFGPKQVVEFHQSANSEERAIQARRAFELVRKFLALLDA